MKQIRDKHKYDINGTKFVSYTYDAWGNFTTTYHNGGASTTAVNNPFRYRGYYYDSETGLYYLNSRYYDPIAGRFISADSYVSTGQGLIGYNMYAYCNNNPVNMVDFEGTKPLFIQRIGVVKPVVVEIFSGIINKVIDNTKKDISNFNANNTNEQIVFEANYFSSYKGKLVIKTPFDASFSFGFIGLSNKQLNSNTLNHEHGHTLQLELMGKVDYIYNVAVPSLTINLLDRMGKLPYDYYGSPWEAEADKLGDVKRTSNNQSWPAGSYDSYFDLLMLLFS